MMRNQHTMRDAVSASGEMTVDWGPQGLQITDGRPRPVWGRITGVAAATNRYSWTQVNESDSTFPDLGSGFAGSGTTDVGQWPAYEVNGTTTVAVGTKVYLWPSPSGQFWMFCDCSGGVTDDFREGVPLNGTSITADNTWTDCSDFEIDLPSAGTYVIWAVVSGVFVCSAIGVAPTAGIAHARLYDVTAGAEIPGTNVALASVTVVNRQHSASVGLTTGYVASAATTVRVQGYRFGGVTWTTCQINSSGGFGDIGIGYIKVG